MAFRKITAPGSRLAHHVGVRNSRWRNRRSLPRCAPGSGRPVGVEWAGVVGPGLVLILDPIRRGLSGEERYERSVHVLELVAAKIPQCITAAQATADADLINAVNAALKQRVAVPGQTDAVEANVDLANKLWQAERTTCASAVSPEDQPLQLVLAKAAQ